MTGLLQRLAIPLATGVAAGVFATRQADRSGAPDTAFLGFLAVVALLALAATPPDRWARIVERFVAVVTVGMLLALPPGPARAAALSAVLLAALFRTIVATPVAGVTWRELSRRWLPPAIALGVLTHPELLVQLEIDGPPPGPRMALWWILVPAALAVGAAALTAALAHRTRGTGWTNALAGVAHVTLLSVFVTSFFAGYPWLSDAPVRRALAAVSNLDRTVEPVLTDPVVLTSEVPLWTWAPDTGVRVRGDAVLIDTYLSHASAMEPGEVIVRLAAETTTGETVADELAVGRHTDDWSSKRRGGAPEPRVQQLWANGRTFARRWRTRVPLPPGAELSAIRLERTPTAAGPVQVVITWVGIER